MAGVPHCIARSVDDVRSILQMGADKVAINTAAIKDESITTQVAEAFGSQCMVLGIEAKKRRDAEGWEAYTDNGRNHSGKDAVEWARRGVALGAGEILLTMVDREGLEKGMDTELIAELCSAVNVPVIVSGGCGCARDAVDAARAGASVLNRSSSSARRALAVRRQKFWDSRAADLVEGWPRLGLRFRRRFCGAASADVRGSGA